MDHSTETG